MKLILNKKHLALGTLAIAVWQPLFVTTTAFAEGSYSKSEDSRQLPSGEMKPSESRARFDSDREVRDSDNSAINKRDRDSSAVLPTDQGSSERARTMAANIRSRLTDNDSLSTYAKNVKIIALDNGTVILRGPVRSEVERAEIEKIARTAAPDWSIQNLLEIAGKSAS